MSVHTTIVSNIRHLDDLCLILDMQGIPWERIPVTFKGSNKRVFCGVMAWISGETILIYQEHPDEPFAFQSEDVVFRNKSSMETLALDSMEFVAHKGQEAEEKKRHNNETGAKRKDEDRATLQQQATEILQRLESEKTAKRPEQNKSDVDWPPTPPSSTLQKDIIGKLHQQNALRKILETLNTLDQEMGLSLYTQETLDDETIELTLRG